MINDTFCKDVLACLESVSDLIVKLSKAVNFTDKLIKTSLMLDKSPEMILIRYKCNFPTMEFF